MKLSIIEIDPQDEYDIDALAALSGFLSQSLHSRTTNTPERTLAPNMESRITITISQDYIPELAERMAKYGISRAELAREMGKSEQEVGRWFNSKRRFGQQWTPKLQNIQRIEQAVIDLRRRKTRGAR